MGDTGAEILCKLACAVTASKSGGSSSDANSLMFEGRGRPSSTWSLTLPPSTFLFYPGPPGVQDARRPGGQKLYSVP